MKHTTNPFDFDGKVNANQGSLPSAELIGISNAAATELMKKISSDAKLHERGQNLLAGNAADLFSMIDDMKVVDKNASDILKGLTDDELKRLLESRRSQRSKSKATGLTTTLDVRTYISAGIAEVIVRQAMGTEYADAASRIQVDASDPDTVTRRIKSLQSKQSRLRKLAEYDDAAAESLSEVVAEIDELRAMLPTRVKTKKQSKDDKLTELRKALDMIDIDSLPEAEAERIREIQAKIG